MEKEIKYYFNKTTKENAASEHNCTSEVKIEGAKMPEIFHPESKKRERVKIKIKSASSGAGECELVESKMDLIDKTPSPLCNKKSAKGRLNDETPKSRKCSYDNINKDDSEVAEQVKENIAESVNSEKNEVDDDKPEIISVLLSKSNNENLKENSANKKELEKRKRKGKEEEKEAERVIKKKKKDVTEDTPGKNGKIQLNGEKKAGSLLNYFSKATPEQLQKEKTAMSTIVVQAEIHHIDGEKIVPLFSATPKNISKQKRKKRKSDADLLLSTADEIKVLSSEDISLPVDGEAAENFDSTGNLDSILMNRSTKTLDSTPKRDSTPKTHSIFNNKLTPKSNKTPRNKPKWSMKIKLNSSADDKDDKVVPDIDLSDEEIFTPRSQLKAKTSDSADNDKCQEKQEKKDSTKINQEKSSGISPDYPDKVERITKISSGFDISALGKETQMEIVQLIKDAAVKEVMRLDEKNKKPNPLKLKKTESSSKIEKSMVPSKSTANVQKLAPIFLKRNNSFKENNNSDESLKRKSTEKLASLFVKRSKPDPEVLLARRLFLQPECIDLTDKPPPKAPVLLPPANFPKISHVTQSAETKKVECEGHLRFKKWERYDPIFNLQEMKNVISYNESPKTAGNAMKEVADTEVEAAAEEIVTRCEISSTFWKRLSIVEKKPEIKIEEVKPKKKRGRPRKNPEPTMNFETEKDEDNLLGSFVWTSKYKPTSSSEVVGNVEAVKKLRDWLKCWKAKTEEKEQSDSEDDFYSSDCSRSSFVKKNQVAILMGPHGCGKTSSVYAVAEEMGYSVIEVNASSKRPGKKILKDLEEATKSHRIRNHNMESFGFGVKKSDNEKTIPGKSLILLDDIDLVFEEDDGFINAAYQLASNTKRPIAMTCKNSFSQLSKIAPHLVKIEFEAVCCKKASAFLELVSLAETKCRLPLSCAESLTMNGDLRKALLQLQYLLISGQATSVSVVQNPRPSLWKETDSSLYRPIIKATKSMKKKLQKQNCENEMTLETKQNEWNHLEQIASSIDNISLLSGLAKQRDVAFESIEYLGQDSLSLVEKRHNYNSSDVLGNEISSWITQYSMSESSSVEFKSLNSLLNKKKITEGINMVLTETTTWSLDKHTLAMDTLPYVRAICRAEENRQNNNLKRGNRFYHYLQSIVTVRPHSFAVACKMFQDKSKDKRKDHEDNE